MGHRRPKITEEKIGQINSLLKQNPDWGRTRLSVELCELWDWKSEAGQLKTISCRDVLRALDSAGRINLPPQIRAARKAGASNNIQLSFHDETPIEASLKSVVPVSVSIARTKPEIDEFKSYIDNYHYLAYGQSVGECMRYFVRSRDGSMLACLLFGSSAWRCSPRDKFIGWDDRARNASLHLTTNNTRFLVLPHVRVPHLASHVLSVISKRISGDWQDKYGHGICFLETFVERDRFRGVCYRAANWIRVGETAGRGRDSVTKEATLAKKDIYVYPLTKNFKALLSQKASPSAGGEGSA